MDSPQTRSLQACGVAKVNTVISKHLNFSIKSNKIVLPFPHHHKHPQLVLQKTSHETAWCCLKALVTLILQGFEPTTSWTLLPFAPPNSQTADASTRRRLERPLAVAQRCNSSAAADRQTNAISSGRAKFRLRPFHFYCLLALLKHSVRFIPPTLIHKKVKIW